MEPGCGTSVFFIAKNPSSLSETRPPQNGRPTRPTDHHGGRSGGPFVRYRLAPRAKLIAGQHGLRCQLATQVFVQRRTHLPVELADVTIDLSAEELRVDDELRDQRCFLHHEGLGACRMLCEQAHGQSNSRSRQ